jgi:NTP pyrophosphatase (non-canonical NTP hydrolase)
MSELEEIKRMRTYVTNPASKPLSDYPIDNCYPMDWPYAVLMRTAENIDTPFRTVVGVGNSRDAAWDDARTNLAASKPLASPPVAEMNCFQCGISSTKISGYTGGVANIEFLCAPCWMKAFVCDPAPLATPTPEGTGRNVQQRRIGEWAVAAFGEAEALSLPQRGLRLLEEAAEAAQAAGVLEEQARHLVGYVWARPVGRLSQELGGVGVTTLALAHAAGFSAAGAEDAEIARVLSKPIEHFSKRNKEKNDAGLLAAPAEPGTEGDK